MPKIIIHNPDGTQAKYGLNGKVFTIGRAPNNDIVLPEGGASSHHAVLKLLESGDFSVTDLGSTNATKVTGRKVQTMNLRNGDSLLFGDIAATYESDIVPPPLGFDDQPTQIYEQAPPPAAPGTPPPAPGQKAAPYVIQRPVSTTVRRSSQDGGCFSLIAFTLIIVCGFLGGLIWRHHSEHEGQWIWNYVREVVHNQ